MDLRATGIAVALLTKCGGSFLFDFAQGKNDKPIVVTEVDLSLTEMGTAWFVLLSNSKLGRIRTHLFVDWRRWGVSLNLESKQTARPGS